MDEIIIYGIVIFVILALIGLVIATIRYSNNQFNEDPPLITSYGDIVNVKVKHIRRYKARLFVKAPDIEDLTYYEEYTFRKVENNYKNIPSKRQKQRFIFNFILSYFITTVFVVLFCVLINRGSTPNFIFIFFIYLFVALLDFVEFNEDILKIKYYFKNQENLALNKKQTEEEIRNHCRTLGYDFVPDWCIKEGVFPTTEEMAKIKAHRDSLAKQKSTNNNENNTWEI